MLKHVNGIQFRFKGLSGLRCLRQGCAKGIPPVFFRSKSRETPYFLPNEPVLFALKTAAVGGVDVRIICPLHSDSRFTEWASRSYLRELYEAGAKVYLYQPGFLHSKLMLIDDSLSTCGSTNVDFRSFENNFEANVFIYDEATTLRLKHIFLDDQSLSVPLQQLPTRLRPDFMQRLWESLTRLLAPLL